MPAAITEKYEQVGESAGFPIWVQTILCMKTAAEIKKQLRFTYLAADLTFISTPFDKQLRVQHRHGRGILKVSISPTNYDKPIKECVAIDTGQIEDAFPLQPAGTYFAAFAVVRLRIRYQQTLLNHLAP